jgi:hypothetical protein
MVELAVLLLLVIMKFSSLNLNPNARRLVILPWGSSTPTEKCRQYSYL